MLARYRNLVTPLAIVAAVILVYMENPWFTPEQGSTVSSVASIAFWVLTIAVIVLMFQDSRNPEAQTVDVEGPAFARYLFSNTRAGLFWLPIRIFLGFEWLVAGWEKITGKGWIDGGASLLGYWQNAVKIPATGRPPITFDWYRAFLQFLIDNHLEGIGGWIIAFGEAAVGVGLLVGALVGFAAFFGVVMNMSYLLAGSTSTNPIMFALAIGLMLAWKVAGYYGLDRYLLPLLGVPWHAKVRAAVPPTSAPPTTAPPAPRMGSQPTG